MATSNNRAARRAEIISAAETVLGQRGLDRITVDDIVSEANVAKGTFYLYFKSKDEVVLAVAQRYADAIAKGIEQVLTMPVSTAVDRLRALIDVFSNWATFPGAEELIALMHRKENRPLHDRLTEELTPRLVEIITQIIEEGVDQGLFTVSNVHAAAWFVIGGIMSVELSGVQFTEMPAALSTATEFALRALGYDGPV